MYPRVTLLNIWFFLSCCHGYAWLHRSKTWQKVVKNASSTDNLHRILFFLVAVMAYCIPCFIGTRFVRWSGGPWFISSGFVHTKLIKKTDTIGWNDTIIVFACEKHVPVRMTSTFWKTSINFRLSTPRHRPSFENVTFWMCFDLMSTLKRLKMHTWKHSPKTLFKTLTLFPPPSLFYACADDDSTSFPIVSTFLIV